MPIIERNLKPDTKKVASISNIKETKRIAKEKKFGKMMFIIMALFFGTYFPTYILKKVDFNISKYISITILFLNSNESFKCLNIIHIKDRSASNKNPYNGDNHFPNHPQSLQKLSATSQSQLNRL